MRPIYPALAGIFLLLLIGFTLWGGGPCIGDHCNECCAAAPGPSASPTPTTTPTTTATPRIPRSSQTAGVTPTGRVDDLPTTTPTSFKSPEPAGVPSPIVFQFDFDKDSIPPRETEKFTKYVEQLRNLPGAGHTILVVGHACRIGKVDYNLGLSRRRAETVKRRLESDLDSAQYKFDGILPMGILEPLEVTKKCEGLAFGGLKKCLEPNRRVLVTVK